MTAARPAASVQPTTAPTWLAQALNVVAFQAGWFACVLGAARGMAWMGIGLAVIVVAAHVVTSPRPRAAALVVLLAVLVGALWDTALASAGLLAFGAGAVAAAPGFVLAPPWILALWALFATTLDVSMRWLHGRWRVAALLGAAAGPLSYWAGERLGALAFGPAPVLTLVVLGLGWAVFMPALLGLARRLGRSA